MGSALDALATLPEASAGAARVSQAVRAVRFSTGLRRGWAEARTEASIQWVVNDYRASGGEISTRTLREQVAWLGEPSAPRASAAWRCHSEVVADMPPLVTKDTAPAPHASTRTMLARLHRDASSAHPDMSVRQRAGILSTEDSVRQDLLLDIAESAAPGLVTIAVLLGQWLSQPLSAEGNATIRDSFVRWFATVRGFEPTGTAVLDIKTLESHLSDYESGSSAGMDAWLGHVADMYVSAMTRSLRISQSILAGRTDPELG
ncbi:hypothetical protein [Flaviflexus equikiangi]|uniref:Uncharacterized protein n=1 Tax=Flaviflexus equikiangi TaxID=2758573 RepID=A0ABS2TCD9_9ACTO|nr:hypothetical protein [Flaviflexus equikiangi]MBM9432304.1 hypothetical protein [Flaviflexus equikiangi]